MSDLFFASGNGLTDSIGTPELKNNAVTDGKLATAVQNVLPDRLKASSMVVLTRSFATGTSQPASVADATFAGKTAGGAVNGAGTVGVVAGSFAGATAETGTASSEAGLGSTPNASQPYNITDFAGQNRVVVRLQKADGDEPVLADMLSSASGDDISAQVYAYLSYRSDLGADLKWRVWYYYRRASDGLETPFTPDTSLTGVTMLVPEVFLMTDVPVAHGVGSAAVGSQAAAAVGAKGISTAMLADAAVTDAKIGTDAVTTAKILDANVTAAKLAADSVTTAKILDSNVTAAKIGADAVTTAKILDANVTAAKLAADSVTTAKILDANVTAAKLAADSVTTAKILDANVTSAKLAAQLAFTVKRSAKAASATSAGEEIIGVTDTSSPRTITVATADLANGKRMIIKDESGGAATNNITITGEGGETFDGVSSLTITANYGVARLYSNGTNWFTF